MPVDGGVTAVLWDADGVLQQEPATWTDQLAAIVGEQESLELVDLLLPQLRLALRGEVSMTERLPEVLAERDLGQHAERIREVWGTVDPIEPTRSFVRELRNAGLGCHLATNQDDLRTSYMRERMGYDELLDRCFYSCEVGAAKPDERFFRLVADELGLELSEL